MRCPTARAVARSTSTAEMRLNTPPGESHIPNTNSGHRMPWGILGEDPQVNLLRIASRLMFQHHVHGLVGFQIRFEHARSEIRGARASDAHDTRVGVVDVSHTWIQHAIWTNGPEPAVAGRC